MAMKSRFDGKAGSRAHAHRSLEVLVPALDTPDANGRISAATAFSTVGSARVQAIKGTDGEPFGVTVNGADPRL